MLLPLEVYISLLAGEGIFFWDENNIFWVKIIFFIANSKYILGICDAIELYFSNIKFYET